MFGVALAWCVFGMTSDGGGWDDPEQHMDAACGPEHHVGATGGPEQVCGCLGWPLAWAVVWDDP